MINLTYKSILLAGLASFAMGAQAAAPADAAKPAEVKAEADHAKTEEKAPAKAKGKKRASKKHAHNHHHDAKPVVAEEKPKVADAVADIKLAGYVQLDSTYDAKQFAGDAIDLSSAFYDSLNVNSAPQDNVRKNVFNAHVKQTRANLTAKQQTASGDLKEVIEFNFFATNSIGASSNRPDNTYQLKLRHAYVEWNGFTVGQTWSNFCDAPQNFETLDANGVNTYFRLPIVKYTYVANDKLNLIVALNRPGTEYTETMVSSTPAAVRYDAWAAGSLAKDTQPDVTLRANYDLGGGHNANLRGVYRNLTVQQNDGTVNGVANQTVSASKNGYGVGATVNLNVMNVGTLSVQYNWGNGIGHHIQDLDGQAAVYDKSLNKLDLQRASNVVATYNHKLSDKLSANVGYSYSKVNVSPLLKQVVRDYKTGLSYTSSGGLGRAGANTSCVVPAKSYQRIFVNLEYAPTKNVMLGAEWTTQVRKSVSDATFPEFKATIQRFALAAKYSF